MSQNPNLIYVLPPKNFGFNGETAADNYFQKKGESKSNLSILAANEHAEFCQKLTEFDVEFHALTDSADIVLPDALFLNNWFSVTKDHRLVLYPMLAKSRRSEVRQELIHEIKEKSEISELLDYRDFINQDMYCEGTGSLIFDHENKLAFVCVSKRSTPKLCEIICKDLGYKLVTFEALDLNGRQIYHTNVMLSIGENVAVICFEAIEDPLEKAFVRKYLQKSNRIILEISLKQMQNFCGNVFEVNDKKGIPVLLMSESAYINFEEKQINSINQRVKVLKVAIPTIEKYGGGGVRCMVAAG